MHTKIWEQKHLHLKEQCKRILIVKKRIPIAKLKFLSVGLLCIARKELGGESLCSEAMFRTV